MNSDFGELLSAFNEAGVRNLIVGNYALMLCGEPPVTRELTLWEDTSSENAACVYSALAAFGLPLDDIVADEFAQDDFCYQVGTPTVRADVITLAGRLEFGEAWRRRRVADCDGVNGSFISRQDLRCNAG